MLVYQTETKFEIHPVKTTYLDALYNVIKTKLLNMLRRLVDLVVAVLEF